MKNRLYSERTSLQTIIVSLITIIIGVFLLFLSDSLPILQANKSFQSVVRDLGSLLVSSVTIAMLWELVAKRAFLEELMIRVKLADEVREAGLLSIINEPRKVDWDRMFSNVRNLDIFFVYGRSWRAFNNNYLRRLASNSSAKIRVILPDPANEKLMEELSARFYKPAQKLKELIQEAEDDFKEIFKNNDFSLWYFNDSPVYSCYRFDNKFVLTIYHHGPVKHKEVPTLVVEEGGSIYDFLEQEFESFVEKDSKLARKAFDSQNKPAS